MPRRRPSRWILIISAILAQAGGAGAAAAPDGTAGLDPAGAQGSGGEVAPQQLREELRRVIIAARDRVFPALVNIQVVTVSYFDGRERKLRGTGSGTIISPQGYVLTNQHVTYNGRKFTCTLADKQEISAALVGEDALTDLAVLKLNLSELKPGTTVTVAGFGESEQLQVGDYVMAMGSPLALARSVTLGVVSNTERILIGRLADDFDDFELDSGQRTGLFTRWIQHDAAINPGNSGGPLVNLRGEIVGVNELKVGGDGMGLAIPSSLARQVADALIQHGEVPRSWIGVSFKATQKTGLSAGVLVNSVVEDSPADQAGIRAGDVVTHLDGAAVDVRFMEQVPPLMKRIADAPIGATLRLTYERDGQSGVAEVRTAKLLKDRGDERAFRGWGLTAMEITDKLARDLRLDGTDGVLVSSTRGGGAAQLAEPPLAPGDVIRALESTPVADLDGFVAAYERIMSADPLPEYVLVVFDRRGKQTVTLLKPKPDQDPDPPREVAKAWLGVATQPVLKKLAEKLGAGALSGFRVTRVFPGTTVAGGELRVGDVIVALNGEKLSARGNQDAPVLDQKVRQLEIGAAASLTVWREGQTLTVPVTLDRTRLTPGEARKERNRDFELVGREVTFFDRDERRWDESVSGVIVESVEPAGWAGIGGLRSGDLVQRIDAHAVTNLATFRSALAAVTEAQPARVVFVVLRGAQSNYLFVEPDWKPTSTPGAAPDGKE